MPGRIIHWDLEAELNQLEEQGELQQDQEAGLRQADQQNQPMPWDANHEEWQLPPPSARRQPVSQQLRPVPGRGDLKLIKGLRNHGNQFKDKGGYADKWGQPDLISRTQRYGRPSLTCLAFLRSQCWIRSPQTSGWRTSETHWMPQA